VIDQILLLRYESSLHVNFFRSLALKNCLMELGLYGWQTQWNLVNIDFERLRHGYAHIINKLVFAATISVFPNC